jgi:hypothetical protein
VKTNKKKIRIRIIISVHQSLHKITTQMSPSLRSIEKKTRSQRRAYVMGGNRWIFNELINKCAQWRTDARPCGWLTVMVYVNVSPPWEYRKQQMIIQEALPNWNTKN